MRSTLRTILAAAVLAPCGLAAAQAQAPVNVGDVNARVRALEDREAIRTLWAEYGRTLDARDFTAFARLFARDAEFVGGPGSPAKGPAAIGTFLEKAIGTNYPNSKGRNFHLYFNETIDLRGDEGSAVSKGGFLMTNAENAKADVLLLATYRDQFVREDGRWKFKRREVIGEIPVPRAAVPTQAGQAVAADVVGVGNFSHIVSNFDRSLEFYRDVLGLEVTVSQPFSPNPAIMALGNTPGAQSRFTALRVPGSGIGVELIEYKDIDRRPQSPRFHDPGAANLALQVRDLSAILPRLRKFGARIITDGGTPAAIGNGLYLFVQDPDGFVVELAQGTPPADSKVPASNNIYGGQFELTVADSFRSYLATADLTDRSVQLSHERVNAYWVTLPDATIPAPPAAASSETWNFLTYFKPTVFIDHTDPAVTSRRTDYRSPDPLAVLVGQPWIDSNENTAAGDDFNEAEAAYLLTLDPNPGQGLTFEIDGTLAAPRYSPFFKVRQWRSLTDTPIVRLNGSPRRTLNGSLAVSSALTVAAAVVRWVSRVVNAPDQLTTTSSPAPIRYGPDCH